MDADIAAVVKLARVKVPALDEPLGQHRGWPREFGVWEKESLALDRCVASIARLGGARQTIVRFASNPEYEYNT